MSDDTDGPTDGAGSTVDGAGYERELDRQLGRLAEAGIAPPEERAGCSAEEITELERAEDVTLPGAYRWYLRRLGRDSGSFMRGSDREYPAVRRLTDGLRELAAAGGAAGEVPEPAFAFVGHQGYVYLYFDATAGENPPVSRYVEDDPEPERVCETFTEWFAWTVDDEIDQHGTPGADG